MAHAKRIPPIKIKVDIRSYNFLVEILSIHAERNDERLSKKSGKLKDKLLRYAVPFETEDKETLIENVVDELDLNVSYATEDQIDSLFINRNNMLRL